MKQVKIFHNMKLAFIHIKMDIARFKIRRARFPYLCPGIKALDFLSGRISDASAVDFGINE